MYSKLVGGILKGVLAMALADGELQQEERELIELLTERFGLEEGELIKAVGDAKSLDKAAFEGKLDHEDKVMVAQYAVMAAFADGSVQQEELKFLDELGHKLDLKEDDLRRLEGLCREFATVVKEQPVDVSKLNEVLDAYC